MIESEAKKKWCPFVRIGLVAQMAGTQTRMAGFNWVGLTSEEIPVGSPESEPRPIGHCLSSDCAVWIPGPDYVDTSPEATDNTPQRTGLCGLAHPPKYNYYG